MFEESDGKFSIKIEDYYQLIASKVVLDVLNKSISFLKVNHSSMDQNSIDVNSIEFLLSNQEDRDAKKSDAWDINFSNDSKTKYSPRKPFLNINYLNSSNLMRTKKYLNKKRW